MTDKVITLLDNTHETLITDLTAQEYFQGAVGKAVSNQKLQVCTETTAYLINLLTNYIHSDRLYDQTPDGVMIKPLAQMYLDALESQFPEERLNNLRQLGDVALFISGLFAQSLNRSLVDIDYYISMGGNAYSVLSDSSSRSNASDLRDVFSELSRKFSDIVDVLSEVAEIINLNNCTDTMRLYEIWMHTGSPRVAEKLKRQGISPVNINIRTH